MAKYKEFKLKWGGQQYIFVTRGRSKEFTAEEAIQYVQSRPLEFPAHPIVPPQVAVFSDKDMAEVDPGYTVDKEARSKIYEGGWSIPDDRQRKNLFRNELKQGIDFCVKKYGQTEETIKAEARRLGLGGF